MEQEDHTYLKRNTTTREQRVDHCGIVYNNNGAMMVMATGESHTVLPGQVITCNTISRVAMLKMLDDILSTTTSHLLIILKIKSYSYGYITGITKFVKKLSWKRTKCYCKRVPYKVFPTP